MHIEKIKEIAVPEDTMHMFNLKYVYVNCGIYIFFKKSTSVIYSNTYFLKKYVTFPNF